MFYVIGLGLSDEKDITVKGLEVGTNRSIMTGHTDIPGSQEMRAGLPRILHLHSNDLEREAGMVFQVREFEGS